MTLNLLDQLSDDEPDVRAKTGKILQLAVLVLPLVAYAITPWLTTFISANDLLAPVVFMNVGVAFAAPLCLIIFASCTSFPLAARMAGSIVIVSFALFASMLGFNHFEPEFYAIVAAFPYWFLCGSIPLLGMRYFGKLKISFPNFDAEQGDSHLTIAGIILFTVAIAFSISLLPLSRTVIDPQITYKAGILTAGAGCLLIPWVATVMSANRPAAYATTITVGQSILVLVAARVIGGSSVSSWKCFGLATAAFSAAGLINTYLVSLGLQGAIISKRDTVQS